MVIEELFSSVILPLWIGRSPAVLLEPMVAHG
jgi:hypothetical protein